MLQFERSGQLFAKIRLQRLEKKNAEGRQDDINSLTLTPHHILKCLSYKKNPLPIVSSFSQIRIPTFLN